MSVDQSGGLRMEIGVLYLSHAMLVLAELIVCSTREFACILAKWFWPTVVSLSLTYGSPEASCNKRADTYLLFEVFYHSFYCYARGRNLPEQMSIRG